MARENKIGLLVGLTFIIAVGILISNYLSVNNERPQASLQVVGSAVRSSLGDARPAVEPSSAPAVVRVPSAVAPTGQVTTAGELAERARRPVAPVAPPVAPIRTDTVDPNPPAAFAADTAHPAAVPPGMNQGLLDAARAVGQDIVAPTDPAPTPVPPRHTMARTVVAEPGDSLSDLAEKAYGSSTRATRDALVAANPSLRENRNLIVAGRGYLVSAVDAAEATPARSSPKPSATVAIYTVQEGDTLCSIARQEVGTVKAVAAIRDLNGLQGDRLRLNMRLRLPKRKSVATAD